MWLELPPAGPPGLWGALGSSRRGLPGLGATYDEESWVTLLMFVLGAIVFAAIWSRFFRRGPLEYLLHAATEPAKHIR
ncbi:putative membrane protein YeiB [Streptomyces afghaniensis]|nr:putative membrane protein YeiB [Streptomyces afghaniensis]